MIVATHRVIGLLEWPLNSEPTPEMLTLLNHEPLLGDLPNGRILSLRLPVPDSHTTVLSSRRSAAPPRPAAAVSDIYGSGINGLLHHSLTASRKRLCANGTNSLLGNAVNTMRIFCPFCCFRPFCEEAKGRKHKKNAQR